MDFRMFPWISVDFHGFSQVLVNFHSFSLGFHGFLCIPRISMGFSWISMD